MRKFVFMTVCFVLMTCSIFGQKVIEISPSEAFDLAMKADTYLIDVRTIAEYVYVGHPENALCIPLLFWDEKAQAQVRNDNFLQDLASRFNKGDTLVFVCRSGNRSPVTARMAAGAGFQKVFNVPEGFEGKKNVNGYRTVDGWKNAGLPYTYKLKAELIYRK